MKNLLLKAFLLFFAFNLFSATLLKKESTSFFETKSFSTISFLDENGFYIFTDIPAEKQYVMLAYGRRNFVIDTTSNAVNVQGKGSLSLEANNNPNTICSASGLELACGAGNCPSPYPDIGAYPIVNGRDNNYAVFIGGDLNITGGKEIEGKSFIYGDFNFLNPGGSYNAGYVGLGSGVVPDANTVWVTVGGNLNTNGTTFLAAGDTGSDAGEGTVVVKGTADPNDFIADNGELVVDPTLDLYIYDACFTTINTQSQCWSGETSSPNGTYVDDGFGSYNFTSTDGASGLYVFNIADDMGAGLAFSGAANFTGFPNDATILINVDKLGSPDNVTLNIGSFNGLTDELRQRIIWNFPDTENLTIEGNSQFWGSLVIPSRTSSLNLLEVPGFNGRLMAGGDVAHVAAGSEFHNYSFEGDLSSLSCASSCTSPTADAPTSVEGTCTGTTANNDATITLNNITNADIAGIVAGADYTSGIAYNADASTNAALEAVAANTVTFSSLMHNTQYTVRVFNAANDCFTDFTTTSVVINCDCSTIDTTNIFGAVCQGNNYPFNNQNLTINGTYLDTLTQINGCDSIIRLSLTILDTIQTPISQDLCQGDSHMFNGQALTMSGTYRDTLMRTNGCDSFIVLNLTVYPIPDLVTRDTMVCNGYSIDIANLIIDNNNTVGSQTYHLTLADANDGTNVQNSLVSPSDTTTYYIRKVTDVGACFIVDSLTINILLCDWGDLPDPNIATNIANYQTLRDSVGPVHVIIPGLNLGATVDGEINGQPSEDALGDGNDEDGLTISPTLDIVSGGILRLPLSYVNTTSDTAYIEAWIDWNGDGDFEDTNEMVLDVKDPTQGLFDRININVPTDALSGQLLGVRIRISNTDNMTPYGQVSTGEVEDYLFGIDCPSVICVPIKIEIRKK